MSEVVVDATATAMTSENKESNATTDEKSSAKESNPAETENMHNEENIGNAPPAKTNADPATTQASTATADEDASKDLEASKRSSNEEAADEDDGEDVETEKQTIDIHRPVKKARTAYFIFADEKRSQMNAVENPTPIPMKEMGALWANATDEEKLVYQQKAAEERERVAEAVEAWKAAGGTLPDMATTTETSSSLVFPVNRIRKICKLDPEVRGLSKEALLLITKAAELALVKVAKETVKTAQIQNRRKLLPEDLVQVCSARDQFQFLREDIQDLHRKQQKEATQNKDVKGKKEVENTGTKTITDYFASK